MRPGPLVARYLFGMILGVSIFGMGEASGSGTGASVEADSVAVESLEDLLVEAEGSNPAILAARARVEAAADRPSQAGSLPDPRIGAAISNFEFDDFALDSSPMAGIEIRFRQVIPFPGKLGKRRAVANAQLTVSEKIALEVTGDVRSSVKSSYWSLSAASAIEQVTQDNLALLEELVDVAISRFAVGMGAQQDVLQAQAALSELNAQLLQRQQETRTAQRALKISVGRSADSPPIRTTQLEVESPTSLAVRFDDMQDELNPDLQVQVAKVVTAERSLDEALKDRWPDFAVGGGYRIREFIGGGVSTGANMVSLSLDMSIPLYASSKQNRRVSEAQARLVAERHVEADVRLQVEALTQDLLDEVTRISRQVRLYRDEVIPQDRLALDAAVSDYSVAELEFLTVLSNWRSLLRDELTMHSLTGTLGVRLAQLEYVIGRDLQ